MKAIVLSAVAALSVICSPVMAADEVRTEQVRFAAGASGTSIKDSITGYESVLYKIGAEAGQRMKIRLEPSNLSTYFNVYAPGKGPGDAALANASLTGAMVPDLNLFDGTLPVSGDYTVSVYMMRNAARREETSDYMITLSVEGAGDAATSSAARADSISTVVVRFPAGSTGTELTGSLAPGESRRYVLGAGNGQNLSVRVAAQAPGLSYQIFNPDRSFLLDQMSADRNYRGELWQSGDHVIEVINRGNATTDYNVIFGID